MNATNHQILTNKKQICNEKSPASTVVSTCRTFILSDLSERMVVSQDVLLLWQHCHGDMVVGLVELLHEVADILRCESLYNLLVV